MEGGWRPASGGLKRKARELQSLRNCRPRAAKA